jgi:uncharacterized protein involved in exopolysaccharide biosynthesis
LSKPQINENGTKDKEMNSTISERGISEYSREEVLAIGYLKERIFVEIEGPVLRVSTQIADPIVSAELNKVFIDYLIEYLTLYKTEKRKNELHYIELELGKAKEKYFNHQNELAQFLDSNRDVQSSRVNLMRNKLEEDVSLSRSIFNKLSLDLENAKINLNKELPTFSTIDLVQSPGSKSSPNFFKIVLIFSFVGVFAGIVIVGVLILIDILKNN